VLRIWDVFPDPDFFHPRSRIKKILTWKLLGFFLFQAGGMPPDSKQAFKSEWEALEVTEHNWALKYVWHIGF
jgi:hypothetical protein